MSGLIIISVVAIFYLLGYFIYGDYLKRSFKIDDSNIPPSRELYDGIDYVPSKSPILLGHHFASIAGAGPIVGPIIAAAFGWIPVILWIILGAIFIGGVHDFSAIIASVRHKGKSIAAVSEKYLGVNGKRLFLIFSWAALILVIAVFINIVADTFEKSPSSATSSIIFLILALFFGLSIYKLKVPVWLATLIGVILIFLGIWVGQVFPISAPKIFWQWSLIIYILVASVTPVWILLQPRDYLNSFVLYALILSGFIGIWFFHPKIQLEGFITFNAPGLGPLFPILFVTIACGAISGFHSLVGSGTTSKQLEKESDAKLIGYGAMLIEGILAALSILAVASLDKETFLQCYKNGQFVLAFATGISNFINAIPFLHIPTKVAKNFAILSVSAFALTSLDTATRIARYNFQELFENTFGSNNKPNLATNRYFATLITVLCGAALTFSGKSSAIWPVFGSANQLLAALSLLTVTLWLSKEKIKYWFTFLPGFFMLFMTLTALISLSYNNFTSGNWLLATIASLLFILACGLSVMSFKILNSDRRKLE